MKLVLLKIFCENISSIYKAKVRTRYGGTLLTQSLYLLRTLGAISKPQISITGLLPGKIGVFWRNVKLLCIYISADQIDDCTVQIM